AATGSEGSAWFRYAEGAVCARERSGRGPRVRARGLEATRFCSDHGPVVAAVVVGTVIDGVVVMTVVGAGGSGAGVVVVAGGFLFVVVGPVVALVVGGIDAGAVDVEVVRRDRVAVALARVGTAGADVCEPAMMTGARSPAARRPTAAN